MDTHVRQRGYAYSLKESQKRDQWLENFSSAPMFQNVANINLGSLKEVRKLLRVCTIRTTHFLKWYLKVKRTVVQKKTSPVLSVFVLFRFFFCSPLRSIAKFLSLTAGQWDVFTKFRAKLPAGRTDWRAFQLTFILYGGCRRRKFGGALWKEKRENMLCHRSWVFPGCSTKTDSCKFELVPARRACF